MKEYILERRSVSIFGSPAAATAAADNKDFLKEFIAPAGALYVFWIISLGYFPNYPSTIPAE
jgi:hypothetical protein